MQLSTLIGKPILSPSGERLGYLTGAYLSRDLKKISSLAAADEEEEEFFLPARAVRSFSDAVIAEKTRAASPAGVPCPIGLPAYSHTGEWLGVVSDWLFGEADPVLVLVKDGIRTPCAADCVSAGETVIVYPDAASRRPAPAKKKRVPAAEREELPAPPDAPEESATPEEPDPTVPSPVSAEKGEQKKAPSPNEYGFNRCNLLGRRVKKSVFSAAGTPVILAGERVTPEVLSRARRYNRLLALAVNTLTNVP